MRVVLDTNVLLSGLMHPDGVPGSIVAAWHRREFQLVLAEPQLEEIARVLAYPKIRKRLQWPDDRIARYIALLRFEVEIVDIAGVDTVMLPDPQDMPILASLIAGQADWLITGDSDFGALGQAHPIITPSEFVRRFL